MGSAFSSCNTSINGFGDSTAGPIWQNSLKPNLPVLGGLEKVTNYPMGDNLKSPINYSGLTESTMIKVFSRVAGPVCGYNIFNIVGLMLSALVMFGFIYYLTRKKWIALMSGFVVTFNPFIQSQIGEHPSYSHVWIFIALLWLFVEFIKSYKLIIGILIALLVAFSFYFDPYFSLLSVTIVVPCLLVLMGSIYIKYKNGSLNKNSTWKIMKTCLISSILFLILIFPLVFIFISQKNQINAQVGSSRPNQYSESVLIQKCSNLPWDYFIPDPYNTFLVSKYGKNYTNNAINLHNWCTASESRTEISITVITVITTGGLLIILDKIKKRKNQLNKILFYDPKTLLITVISVAIFALLIGLPPKFESYPTLSYLILKYFSIWRVFAREYMIVTTAITVLFAITLSYLSAFKSKLTKYIFPIIYLLLFTLIIMEYQVAKPFSPYTFHYNKDIPTIYKTIKDDKKINATAEYPIEQNGVESISLDYYLTMQSFDRKPLFNSINNQIFPLQRAFKSLNDPQTISALRYLGINYLVIHGVDPRTLVSNQQIIVIQSNKISSDIGHFSDLAGTMLRNNNLILASIKRGPIQDKVLVIEDGLYKSFSSDLLSYDNLVKDSFILKNVSLADTKNHNISKVCFNILDYQSPQTNNTIKISQEGMKPIYFIAHNDYTPITFDAKENTPIKFQNLNKNWMFISHFGCS